MWRMEDHLDNPGMLPDLPDKCLQAAIQRQDPTNRMLLVKGICIQMSQRGVPLLPTHTYTHT